MSGTKTIGQLDPSVSIPATALFEMEVGGASRKVTFQQMVGNTLTQYDETGLQDAQHRIDVAMETLNEIVDSIGSAVSAAQSADFSEGARQAAVAARGVAEAAATAAQVALGSTQQAIGGVAPALAAMDDAVEAAIQAKNLAQSASSTATEKAEAAAGSAAQANSSADDAASSSSAATALAVTAATKAQEALDYSAASATSAQGAAASRTASETAASAASTSRVQAESARDAASGSASAAAGSASTASTKSDSAGSSASAAQSSATQALGNAVDAAAAASTASTQASYATAAAASALQSATQSSSIALGSLNQNPTFTAWDNPAAPPANWEWWDASAGIRRDTGQQGRPYALAFDVPANQNAGVSQYMYTTFGSYVIEVTGRATNWNGAGILVQYFNPDGSYYGEARINCGAEADNSGWLSNVDGGGGLYQRTWSKLFSTNIDGNIRSFRIYVLANWEGFEGFSSASGNTHRDAKSISFDRVIFRKAIAPEIAGQRADVNASAALAQINSEAATRAGADYALAQTTNTLTAQVNLWQGSAINSKIDDVSVAAANANYAVAQRTSSLEANYGGLSATVAQQAGVIADVSGKQSFYWQVVGTAGDGRARVALFGANGVGTQFVVDAQDSFFSGNVIIGGSLTIGKLAYGEFNFKLGGNDGGNSRAMSAGQLLGPIAGSANGNFSSHEVEISVSGAIAGGRGGSEPDPFNVYVDLYYNGGNGWQYVANVGIAQSYGYYTGFGFTTRIPGLALGTGQLGIYLNCFGSSGYVQNVAWDARVTFWR